MHDPQTDPETNPDTVAARAVGEFDALAEAIRSAGVEVLVYQDTDNLPDCLFPNNWMSWHEPKGSDPVVVTYPMLDPLRRAERRESVLETVRDFTGSVPRRIDISELENRGQIVEGTGSLVIDRVRGVAIACRSPRTTDDAVRAWEAATGYRVVLFDAVDHTGGTIYHTNVIASIGASASVLCEEAIPDPREREAVLEVLRANGRPVVTISWDQVLTMCGNTLELESINGGSFFVMSTQAFNALRDDQRAVLEPNGPIVHTPIETIERVGGGSVRCMIAELGRAD